MNCSSLMCKKISPVTNAGFVKGLNRKLKMTWEWSWSHRGSFSWLFSLCLCTSTWVPPLVPFLQRFSLQRKKAKETRLSPLRLLLSKQKKNNSSVCYYSVDAFSTLSEEGSATVSPQRNDHCWHTSSLMFASRRLRRTKQLVVIVVVCFSSS